MLSKKIRFFFIISGVFLIIIVLAFTGGLNISSFKKSYTDSLISSYTVVGKECVRKIEYAVKHGKPIENFFGISELLNEIREFSPDIIGTILVSREGKAISEVNGDLKGLLLFEEEYKGLNFDLKNSKKEFNLIHNDNIYHVILPIYDRDQKWIGSIDMIFNSRIIDKHTNDFMNKNIIVLIILSIISIILLFFIIFRVSILSEDKDIKRRMLLIVLLGVVGSSQIIYAIINFITYRELYIENVKENTSMFARIIQKDINQVVGKGVTYEDLNISEWLDKSISSVQEVERIYIADSDNKVLFSSGGLGGLFLSKRYTKYVNVLQLNKEPSGNTATIGVVLSKKHIDGKILSLGLDALTVLAISFIFMVELSLLLIFSIKRKFINILKQEKQGTKTESDLAIVRTLAFLFFLASYMSISFIPILMKNFYTPKLGISENVMMGLPISVEMLCCGISTLISGYVIDKRGWKALLIVGLVILGSGLFMSGFAGNAMLFILARGITGIGFGISFMSLRCITFVFPSVKDRNNSLTGLNSGAYAGINCGCAIGAMISERIGYSNVFFVALISVVLITLFALKFVVSSKELKNKSEYIGLDTKPDLNKVKHKATYKETGVLRFITNKNIASFFLFVAVPVAVCGMFLNYYFPVFAEKSGVSTADIGRAMLLNGLCVIYLGPMLCNLLSNRLGLRKASILAGGLYFLAMIIFAGMGNVPGAIITVTLLGVIDSFALVIHNNYFLSFESSKMIGEGKAVGIYSIATRFGQMIGPIVFGMNTVSGISKGIGSIAFALLFSIIIFTIVTCQRNSIKVR